MWHSIKWDPDFSVFIDIQLKLCQKILVSILLNMHLNLTFSMAELIVFKFD